MIASTMRRKTIDIILILLSFGFIAIPLAALFWHQPKFFPFIQNASLLLSLKRFFP